MSTHPKVHIQAVGLRGPVAADDTALLSPEEMRRADAFAFERHRRRYILSHAALRRCLARRLGFAAERIRYRAGRFGKPALDLDDCPLRFNLSHSEDLALIALTDGGEVGIDLERRRPIRDLAGLAALCLTSAEHEAFLRLAPDRRAGDFYRRWVSKEAVLKALGCGLAGDLRAIEIHDIGGTTGPAPGDACPSASGIAVWQFALPGFAAALALRGSRDATITFTTDGLSGSQPPSCKRVALRINFVRLLAVEHDQSPISIIHRQWI